MAQRQIPGGPFVNEVGTAQRQVPGGAFVNETTSTGGAYALTCDAGAYAIGGQDAALLRGRVLTADAGAYALAGQDAALTYTPGGSTYTLTCDAGAYVLGGQDAALIRGRVVIADAGAYSISGQDAALRWSGEPVADTANATGGWGMLPLWQAKKKKKPTDELTQEVVEAVAEAPKERRTITLKQLIGKQAAAQIDAAELSKAIRTLKLKKRQREDDELMMM